MPTNKNNFFSSWPLAGEIPDFGREEATLVKARGADTDSTLVESFLKGDQDSFAALVERHLPMVYKFSYRYVLNGDDARDIAQDAFIKAWKNINRFDIKRNFKTWLLTIAKNTALDFIKKKKPLTFSAIEAGENDLDAFLAPHVEGPALPDELLQRKYVKAGIEGGLSQLPLSYRTVLTLRYTQHLKFREIAEVLEIPIDTVKSQHRRGIALLKGLIKE